MLKSIKDKINLLPYVVILILNITVMVIFVSNVLLNENYNSVINLHYLLLICLIALLVFIPRILIIGKLTILDRYFVKTKNDWLFLLFICFVLAILITTWIINFFSIEYFLDFFSQDPQNSPIRWFDILNNNFHLLTFYTSIFVLVNLPVVYIYYKFRNYQLKNNLKVNEENFKAILLIVAFIEIFIFLFLFVSDPMIYFWQNLLNLEVFKKILSFIFSGSLIYFNLSFLLRK